LISLHSNPADESGIIKFEFISSTQGSSVDKDLKIVNHLTAVIQANVDEHFGFQRPNNRSLERVRQYAQEMLDLYVKEMMKESEELQKQWILGHPFLALCRVSGETRTYQIRLTTKDNPKGL
jgi:hypothetical protein